MDESLQSLRHRGFKKSLGLTLLYDVHIEHIVRVTRSCNSAVSLNSYSIPCTNYLKCVKSTCLIVLEWMLLKRPISNCIFEDEMKGMLFPVQLETQSEYMWYKYTTNKLMNQFTSIHVWANAPKHTHAYIHRQTHIQQFITSLFGSEIPELLQSSHF